MHFRSLAVLVTCGAFCLATATAMAEDWPRWRGPRGNGTWYGPELPAEWPAEGLALAWRTPLGGGFAGLAVSDGLLVTMDRQEQPEEVERVVCLDAADGSLLWEFRYAVAYGDLDYGNGPRSTPTIHDGRVYSLGAVGHAHCLDASTGERLWSHDFLPAADDPLPEWGLAASPLVYEDLVIFHPGASPDGCYVALKRATGDEVWRSGGDPAGYGTPILAGEGDATQLVGWTPEHIVGMSPRTGAIHWQVPYKVTYGVSIATPIFHRGLVLVCGYWEGSKAIRLGDAPRDARLEWEDTNELQGLMSQPLYRGEHVYLLDKDEGLVCFHLDTGEIVWTDEHQITPAGRNPQANLMWLGDSDRAIILNEAGDLILARLTPEGYEEQSRTNIIQPGEEPIWAHPAMAGGRIFARNEKEIVCRVMVEE